MSLKHTYRLIAFIYDPLIEKATAHWRQHSLSFIKPQNDKKILINGIGSGLDIPHLKRGCEYIGTDITPAMLNKAKNRARNSACNIQLQLADSMALPYENDSFDVVIMHLILAVVPNPQKALQEASRVLKPGGKIHIFDKFLEQGQFAPCRKFLNIFIRHIATRTDVVFETLLDQQPELTITHTEPALAKGWFRFMILSKRK